VLLSVHVQRTTVHIVRGHGQAEAVYDLDGARGLGSAAEPLVVVFPRPRLLADRGEQAHVGIVSALSTVNE